MSRTIACADPLTPRSRHPGSDCRHRCGVIHSATMLQLARRIQLSTLFAMCRRWGTCGQAACVACEANAQPGGWSDW